MRRKLETARDATDRHDPVLKRLPQGLKHAAGELRELVKKKHAAVSERDRARPRPGAASDDRSDRCCMMRRAKGPFVNNRVIGGEESCTAVDLRDFQDLLVSERRQDGHEAFCKHRLTGTRDTVQKHVMPACRRDLKRAL